MENYQRVYVQGSETKGQQVIAALTALGGVNDDIRNYEGNNPDFIYYMDSYGFITAAMKDSYEGERIMRQYKEIKV